MQAVLRVRPTGEPDLLEEAGLVQRVRDRRDGEGRIPPVARVGSCGGDVDLGLGNAAGEQNQDQEEAGWFHGS